MEKRRLLGIVILVIVICFALTRFFVVLWADRVPPIHDPLSLHNLSRLLFEAVKGKEGGFDVFLSHLNNNAYPPLIHYTALPFLAIFGPEKGAESSFALYLAILLLSVYGIGHRFAGRRAGILAVSFALFTPLLDSVSRIYMVDYALAAITAMTVYLLFKSEGFSRRGYSILLALAACVGMFTKQSFILYAGFPLAFCVLFHLIKTPKQERKAVIINIVFFVLIVGSISLVYYLPKLANFFADRRQVNAFYDDIEGDSYRIFPYVWLLIRDGLGPVLALGALVGFFVNARTRGYWVLWHWAIPPILFIDAFHPFESPRYLLPILPAFVVIFAVGLESLVKKIKPRMADLFCLIALIVVLGAFWVNVGLHGTQRFSFDDFHARFQEKGMPRPEKLDWNVDEPVRKIISGSDMGKVVLLLNSPYSEVLQGALLDIDPFADVDALIERASVGSAPDKLKEAESLSAYLDSARWVLFHSEFRRDPRYLNFTGPIDPKVVGPVFDRFFEVKHQFELAGKYPYPEGEGDVLLYERIANPESAEHETPADQQQ